MVCRGAKHAFTSITMADTGSFVLRFQQIQPSSSIRKLSSIPSGVQTAAAAFPSRYIEECKTLSHRHGFTLFAFKNSSVLFFRAVSLASIYLPARTDTLLLQPVKLCHALIHRSAAKKLSYHHACIAPLLHFHTGIGSKNIDILLNPVI